MRTRSKVAIGVGTLALAATMTAAQHAKKTDAAGSVAYNTISTSQSNDGKLVVYTDNFKLTDAGHHDVLGLIRITREANDSNSGCSFTRKFDGKEQSPDLTDSQKKQLSDEIGKAFKACALRQ
ncbi:MAG: hypothetical protein KGI06_05575 [Candidatus Micrarchaeota archaeon]|nr:hypothetical protein [Candidatus Micrarchaeota archaeon]